MNDSRYTLLVHFGDCPPALSTNLNALELIIDIERAMNKPGTTCRKVTIIDSVWNRSFVLEWGEDDGE